MKRQTAQLLRGVLRLIETDVRELADAVVEIDERSSRHQARITDLEASLQELVSYAEQVNRYGIVTREMILDNAEHSRRV